MMAGSCSDSECTSGSCGVKLLDRINALNMEMAEVVKSHTGIQSDYTPVDQGDAVEISINLDEPVPLPLELKSRVLDEGHVWVAVQEASLVVFDEQDNVRMQALARGVTPRELLAAGEDSAALSKMIGRLASAGFLRGLMGYRDYVPPRAERFARLHLTRACQLECSHCYADSSPRVDRTNEISTERWSQFLDDFAAIGGRQVLFTGGEALMHDGCTQLMKQAKELGLHVTLFSNGMLVPKFVDSIKAYADQVQISLDGPTPDANDVVRGRNTFNHILKAIDVLAEAGVRTRIGMTAVPKDWPVWIREFGNIRERYAPFPNITFRLSYGIMSYGRGGEIDSTEVVDRRTVKAFLNDVNGHPGPSITRYQSGCGYAEQVVVGPDGIIYPCHLLDSPVCHIDDKPMQEIAAILWGIGQAFAVDNVEGCKHCEIRYLCGGSCRVLAGRAKGTRLQNLCSAEAKAQKYSNMAKTYIEQFW